MVLFVDVLHPSPMALVGGTAAASMTPWTGAGSMASMAPRAIAPMGPLPTPPPHGAQEVHEAARRGI
jgi:hypothetical protein